MVDSTLLSQNISMYTRYAFSSIIKTIIIILRSYNTRSVRVYLSILEESKRDLGAEGIRLF